MPRRDLELVFNAEVLTAEGIVESLATFEFFTSFGEAFQYSNQLVATGGYAAAAADGARFGELYSGYAASLRRRVLDPIGMGATTLSFEEVVARGDYALPHQFSFADGGYALLELDAERFLTPVAPAGVPLVDRFRYGEVPDHPVEQGRCSKWDARPSRKRACARRGGLRCRCRRRTATASAG